MEYRVLRMFHRGGAWLSCVLLSHNRFEPGWPLAAEDMPEPSEKPELTANNCWPS